MIKEFGYEYDAVLNEPLWEKTQRKNTDKKLLGAHCLRSGRDALKAIAREYKPCVALLPALSCDSMVHPFEQYGHTVVFYRLNHDYSIDIQDMEQKLGLKTTLFLYMDYFGNSAISDASLETLREKHNNLVFIEDRTQNLIWERKSKFNPDYVMASLRKWIAIPDGGLLWGQLTKPLNQDTVFSSLRLKAQCMRHQFLQTGDEEIKADYRKIFSTVSDLMESDDPSAMSAYSYALSEQTDWVMIQKQRQANADRLIAILKPYAKIISGEASALYVPFLVWKRDEVQRTLSSEGIFNTIIWPLSKTQKSICEVAKYTEENMLAAPCDQRYTESDMRYIGQEIVKVIEVING